MVADAVIVQPGDVLVLRKKHWGQLSRMVAGDEVYGTVAFAVRYDEAADEFRLVQIPSLALQAIAPEKFAQVKTLLQADDAPRGVHGALTPFGEQMRERLKTIADRCAIGLESPALEKTPDRYLDLEALQYAIAVLHDQRRVGS